MCIAVYLFISLKEQGYFVLGAMLRPGFFLLHNRQSFPLEISYFKGGDKDWQQMLSTQWPGGDADGWTKDC